MAEWSKALVLGTSLRAWVRIPLQSRQVFFFFTTFIDASDVLRLLTR